ncbi:hypothetical protein GA0074692_4839 [Micromonospora pallida]|uniref:Intracellular septation protein A n=1 Tax=Micromonospora pallida TaxID=145854 RepID=A0A1C6T7Z3_9ACTN|nr:VC0807 family protein [Micromonospora pallida]SCL37940.1 hypothetical protein GA0074692_4839 [Micromonospora pallida]
MAGAAEHPPPVDRPPPVDGPALDRPASVEGPALAEHPPSVDRPASMDRRASVGRSWASAALRGISWRSLRRALVGLLGPLLLYYLLRRFGVAPAPAVVLSNTPAALWTAYGLVTGRSVDKFAVAGLATTALGAALTLAAADPRLVFARSGLVTGGVGIWFLTTARGPRPAALRLTRPLLARFVPWADWDDLWTREPAFRRIWRVTTVLVGTVQILDATLRATLAWTVPLDVLPAVTTATNLTLSPVLLALVNAYHVRAGLYRMLGVGGPFRPR